MHLQLVLFAVATSTLSFDPSGSSARKTPGESSSSAFDRLSTSDRANLRAAHEAARYAVRPVDGGHRAGNPGHRWSTLFDGRGFTTTPDDGAWTWGLELASFGFPGAQQEIEGSAPVSVEGARITYAWSPALEEWYVNDGRGLEHGYTLQERPTRGGEQGGPLTFTLAVRGELCAEVHADDRGIL